MNFLIKALPMASFKTLLPLTDQELAACQAKWITVDEEPGYPCRVSLMDAKVGERVLALTFTHHDVDSPYKASGPIFVREFAEMAVLAVNQVPREMRLRQLSVRAYDSHHMMVGAEVIPGTDVELAIGRQFEDDAVDYLHIHNAKPGCFSCAVHRA